MLVFPLVSIFLPFIILMGTSAGVAQVLPHKLAGYTVVFCGLSWLCALATFVQVLIQGPLHVVLFALPGSTAPIFTFGLLADRFTALMLLLVVTVSSVVHLYSLRAMQEEQHFSRYFTLLSLITVEVMLVILADNLLMLCLFWILKGLTLTLLLAYYHTRPASRRAASLKLRIDLLGDGAFVLALVLGWQLFGTFNIQAINTQALHASSARSSSGVTLLTLCLLLAAMAKSAQLPLHRWLPASVESPTPVSALMHAGLINAGGVLLIRLSPLFALSPISMGLAAGVGALTALYGTSVMLTRSDVKGMLVFSTMGQMGFMTLECGLGAFALAIVHLLAHGLFKATAFLNSGDGVQQKAVDTLFAAPPIPRRFVLYRFLLTLSITALALLATLYLLAFPINTGSILFVFAWITSIQAATTLSQTTRWSIARILFGTVCSIVLYVLGIHALEGFFAPLTPPVPVVPPPLMIALVLLLGALGTVAVLVQFSTPPTRIQQLLARLYVFSLYSGYGTSPFPRQLRHTPGTATLNHVSGE